MGRIPTQKVDEIYNAMDILEVVSDYLPLKKRGQNYWALSPFSSEKTPSFAVNPAKGIYKDFSSGKGGNAISFVMEMEGFSYIEALKHVAQKYNIEIEEEDESPEYREAKDKRQSLFIVNEFATRFYQEQLLENDSGRKIGLTYFKERGLLESTIKEFQLGYAQDDWESFVKAATTQQYQEAYLEELGLASRSEKTGKLYDRFRARVMFPIHNPVGKVIGFGGRILGKQKEMAKYINSPESPIYHKSQVLYGLYQAKKQIRESDQCILTEGYMDTILLHQNGIKQVVASSGTALTVEQIRLIRRFTKNVVMIYDADPAGIKAALRGIDLLIQEGMNPRVVILPGKHDPDSYIQEVGPTAFKEYLNAQSLDFIAFKIQALNKDHPNPNDPQHQAALVKALATTLAHIPDLVSRQMYIKQVAQEVNITESLMTHAVGEAIHGHRELERREQAREKFRANKSSGGEVVELKAFDKLELANQEKELLRILINHFDKRFKDANGGPLEDKDGNPIEYEEIDLLEFYIVELEGLTFENQVYDQLKEELFEKYAHNEQLNLHYYLNHEDSAISRLVSDLLTFTYEISPHWRRHGAFVLDLDENIERVVKGAMFHYKSKKVHKLISEAQQKIQEADNPEASDQYLEMYLHLLEMRKKISQQLGTEGAIIGLDGNL